jgi:hypothetical protein
VSCRHLDVCQVVTQHSDRERGLLRDNTVAERLELGVARHIRYVRHPAVREPHHPLDEAWAQSLSAASVRRLSRSGSCSPDDALPPGDSARVRAPVSTVAASVSVSMMKAVEPVGRW